MKGLGIMSDAMQKALGATAQSEGARRMSTEDLRVILDYLKGGETVGVKDKVSNYFRRNRKWCADRKRPFSIKGTSLYKIAKALSTSNTAQQFRQNLVREMGNTSFAVHTMYPEFRGFTWKKHLFDFDEWTRKTTRVKKKAPDVPEAPTAQAAPIKIVEGIPDGIIAIIQEKILELEACLKESNLLITKVGEDVEALSQLLGTPAADGVAKLNAISEKVAKLTAAFTKHFHEGSGRGPSVPTTISVEEFMR